MEKNIIKIIYLLFIVFISYCILVPILSVIVYGIFSGEAIQLILKYLIRSAQYLLNSFIISIPVTIVATLFGLIIAITLHRINFRGRVLLKFLALVPLINPPFVGSIAFIMLFGRRGLITHKLLGLSVSPFGWQGIVVMQILGLGSLAYILISSSIKRMDISLEEAARNIGASELKIFFSVTLPIMMPEVSSTALLIFLASMADFGTPLIIGGNFQTLASDLYIQITGLYNMQTASISGIILLIPCIGAFLLHRHNTQRHKYFTQSVYSTDIEYKNISLKAKYTLMTITTLFISFICLKYIFIVIGAFTENWGHDYTFTFEHFKAILGKDIKPFINSIKLAFGTATFASFLGVLLAYILKCKKVFLVKTFDILATLPAAVPGILFGIGYLVTFKYPLFGIGKIILTDVKPVMLLGTGMIIYLICIARYLNIGLRTGYALLEHINPDLEKASYDLGAGEIRTFSKIMFPLLKEGFFAAFFKNFASTMTTLGAIIFLLIPSNKIAVQQIFQIITSSAIGVAAAMALMLSLLSMLLIGLFYILFYGKNIIEKWKGRNIWN